MDNLNVLTLIGTRPEIIRLSEIIKKFDKSFNHTLVHTGQNYDYELNEIFFNDLEIRKPDFFLNVKGNSPSEQISSVIKKSDKIFEKVKPDALLILGDTNSSLAAIPAKRKKIPIFHMEAGNRCFNFNVPEEINRKIVDVISDVNLTYSQIAREYLIKENFPSDRIIVTGSPLKEVLISNEKKIKRSKILLELNLKKNNYFLFSFHREENVDKESVLKDFCMLINLLKTKYKKDIVISLHPRTKVNLRKLDIQLPTDIIVSSPLSYSDYIKLQTNSLCVFSDSGSITEESSILKFRAINLRNEHERPEGFEEASVMFVGSDPKLAVIAYEFLKKSDIKKMNIVKDYNKDNVSDKLVKIIYSYSHFIKQKINNTINRS